MNTTAIRVLIRNDFRLYFADRRAMIVGVVVPILIAAFFGYIFGGTGQSDDPGRIPIAVVDEDQSSVSRAIIGDLRTDALLQVSALDRAAAREQVKNGKQFAAAVFPPGFGELYTRSLFTSANKPQVELLVDPSQTTGSRVIVGLLAQYSMQEISKEAFTGAYGRKAIDGYLEQLDKLEQTPLRADLKTLLRAARKLNDLIESGAEPAGAAGSGASGSEGHSFSLSIPYTVITTPVTARDNTLYNAYAISVRRHGGTVHTVRRYRRWRCAAAHPSARHLAATALSAAQQERIHSGARAGDHVHRPISDHGHLPRCHSGVQGNAVSKAAGPDSSSWASPDAC